MVQDNPYLEVWRSLSLDQTELNIFCKWSKLNKIRKTILTSHGFTPTYPKFELAFCAICWQRGGEIHKNSKIGGANKWNDQSKLHTSRGSKLINLYVAFECALHMFACMAQVLNSLSMLVWCILDCRKWLMKWKTSMHRMDRYSLIFYKWSRLNQIGKMILTSHGFTPTYLKFKLAFCANCWQREREIHKDSKIGGANKWNDIVRGSIKITHK